MLHSTLYNPVFPTNEKKMYVWLLTSVKLVSLTFFEIGAAIWFCIPKTLLLRNGFLCAEFQSQVYWFTVPNYSSCRWYLVLCPPCSQHTPQTNATMTCLHSKYNTLAETLSVFTLPIFTLPIFRKPLECVPSCFYWLYQMIVKPSLRKPSL